MLKSMHCQLYYFYITCKWYQNLGTSIHVGLIFILDITKIDEDLPDVLGGPTSSSKSNPRESKPETDSPPESGPDGESSPSEPSGEKQEDDPQAAPTEQKSEEPPVDSNPQPQPEAQTTETQHKKLE